MFANKLSGVYVALVLVCLCVFSVGKAYAVETCELPDVDDNSEGVSIISRKASEMLINGDSKCGIFAFQTAATIVHGIASMQDRIIAGYELKEVALDALQNKRLPNHSNAIQMIRLSLLAVDTRDKIDDSASSNERLSDMAFLMKVIAVFEKNGRTEAVADSYLLMLRLARTSGDKNIPFGTYDAGEVVEWLLKRSNFQAIISAIKEMPNDEYRSYIITRLVHALSFDIGQASSNTYLASYRYGRPWKSSCTRCAPPPASNVNFDRAETLRLARDAQELFVLTEQELQRHPDIKPQPSWHIPLLKFVWRSYLAAGTPEQATQGLDLWIVAIRAQDNRVHRVRNFKDASVDIYFAEIDKSIAIALLNESEVQAKLLTDPAFRDPELQGIDNIRKWMK